LWQGEARNSPSAKYGVSVRAHDPGNFLCRFRAVDLHVPRLQLQETHEVPINDDFDIALSLPREPHEIDKGF
jgi:hypothetical protein